MAPPKLSYGLNLPNKKPQGISLGKPGLSGQKRKKTIFDSDSESDDDSKKNNNAEPAAVEISTIGGLDPPSPERETDNPPPSRKPRLSADSRSASPSTKKNQRPKSSTPTQDDPVSYRNLSALHTSKKNAEEAKEVDPTIYSYDSIYDSIHAKPSSGNNNNSNKDANGNEVPKYMTNLLRSAEVRKRDQLRARDRLLAKEREAEGDEFADKEKFVTAAYKAQQEEVKKIEEEEARREKEEEERRKGGGGMLGFYKDMLDRGEKRHGEAVKAAEEAVEKKRKQLEEGVVEEDEEAKPATQEGEKTEAQIAAELKAQGKNIIVNDEGQVVDKRQLLSAGLNVAPKPKKQAQTQPRATPAASRPSDTARASEAGMSRSAQRFRQTQMVAAQLEEKARQESEAEEAKRKELAEKSKSKKTETDVLSAKERYLARKREREMEAAAKKKG